MSEEKIAAELSSGYLAVSVNPPHQIWYGEYGNPNGSPVIYLHGGPGAGTSSSNLQFFDSAHYRIILIDQRGCGKSKWGPPLAPGESRLEKEDEAWRCNGNTTQELIEDIDKVRKKLGIEKEKIHIFGGSWGSTLALAYAIAHPVSVKSLTLRGIFLGRKRDIDFIFQGDAADLGNPKLMGAGRFISEPWKKFVEFIPQEERTNMITAYRQRILDPDPKVHTEACRHWYAWEYQAMLLNTPKDNEVEYDDIQKIRAMASLETYYSTQNFLLPNNTGEGYILRNVDKLANIRDISIIHGRYDMVCPLDQAEDLDRKLQTIFKATHRSPSMGYSKHIVTAGHYWTEPEIFATLKETMAQIAHREQLQKDGRAIHEPISVVA